MASDNTTAPAVGVEDVAGVRSRISWGAILGGAVVAVAVYLVLTFLFTAIGLSLTEAGIRSKAALGGAAAAALVTVFVALFVGGWVTAQLTAGETQREAMIYGVLTWAVVTGFFLMAVGAGVRGGYFAVVSGTLVAQNGGAFDQAGVEANLRAIGVKQETIDAVKTQVNNPASQEQAQDALVAASWIAFAGTLLSVASAVGGAVVGSGPEFRLFPVMAAGRRQEIIIAR
ncbi:MAG: hypothetical protein K2X82_23445 [Gemmataceae bacterium]|nr:hypothetical protein [Gemmataceae bacterium]